MKLRIAFGCLLSMTLACGGSGGGDAEGAGNAFGNGTTGGPCGGEGINVRSNGDCAGQGSSDQEGTLGSDTSAAPPGANGSGSAVDDRAGASTDRSGEVIGSIVSRDEMEGATKVCFFAVGGAAGSAPSATLRYQLETIPSGQAWHVRLTFARDFVDNSYGATAVGWARGHKFADLVGSDHAELGMSDTSGVERAHFKLDYISQDATSPSGYRTLGVSGGDGKMLVGDPAWIVRARTSMDRNMNERGHVLLGDSPATGASYAPSTTAPDWDYRVVYEAWVDGAAFGAAGLGQVKLATVHASPSKAASNTLEVTPGTCPPEASD